MSPECGIPQIVVATPQSARTMVPMVSPEHKTEPTTTPRRVAKFAIASTSLSFVGAGTNRGIAASKQHEPTRLVCIPRVAPCGVWLLPRSDDPVDQHDTWRRALDKHLYADHALARAARHPREQLRVPPTPDIANSTPRADSCATSTAVMPTQHAGRSLSGGDRHRNATTIHRVDRCAFGTR